MVSPRAEEWAREPGIGGSSGARVNGDDLSARIDSSESVGGLKGGPSLPFIGWVETFAVALGLLVG
jgi:hypothetical protein